MTNHASEKSVLVADRSPSTIVIENIEQMRRDAGIDDKELHVDIKRLRVGDLVRLTLVTNRFAVETVTIRIESIDRKRFTGILAKPALDTRLRRINDGVTLNFTADHIHSIQKIGAEAAQQVRG